MKSGTPCISNDQILTHVDVVQVFGVHSIEAKRFKQRHWADADAQAIFAQTDALYDINPAGAITQFQDDRRGTFAMIASALIAFALIILI